MKHLLKLGDLSREEILSVLNLADQLKYERKNNVNKKYLEGKKLGMIFQKSSTRTRVSFEVGMYELGGYALFLSNRDLQIGRGEPVEDTARVLSRYLDGIMIRTFEQKEVEDLAKYGSIPVINGLTDYCHPCQVLADLMTIRERKGKFKDLKLCFIGDGNNMANSLMVGVGVGVALALLNIDGETPGTCPEEIAHHKVGHCTLTDKLPVIVFGPRGGVAWRGLVNVYRLTLLNADTHVSLRKFQRAVARRDGQGRQSHCQPQPAYHHFSHFITTLSVRTRPSV